jgi:hypothetical protein
VVTGHKSLWSEINSILLCLKWCHSFDW